MDSSGLPVDDMESFNKDGVDTFTGFDIHEDSSLSLQKCKQFHEVL